MDKSADTLSKPHRSPVILDLGLDRIHPVIVKVSLPLKTFDELDEMIALEPGLIGTYDIVVKKRVLFEALLT